MFGIITLHIKLGPFILNTNIHVMYGALNYNLLFGRPQLHAIHVIPSSLHQKVKFIFNNLMYTLHVDTNPNSFLNI